MVSKGNQGWFVDPRNGRQIFWGLFAVCLLLALSELLYHKETHFRWESWFDFHGFYGFVCCVFLVLAAKELRKLVKRDEDYYDR